MFSPRAGEIRSDMEVVVMLKSLLLLWARSLSQPLIDIILQPKPTYLGNSGNSSQ
ncbi:MAG: hypothetical protein V7K57_17745 [Nostoc sp.]